MILLLLANATPIYFCEDTSVERNSYLLNRQGGELYEYRLCEVLPRKQ